MTTPRDHILVRQTRPDDFPAIIALSKTVYSFPPHWNERLLTSHLAIFPEGQLVAIDSSSGTLVGMAASLVIRWNDYNVQGSWKYFTDEGMLTNHDPVRGRTLYGAEVMVSPTMQRSGIGSALYAARRRLVEDLALPRIRAGARLRGYSRYADKMTAEDYAVNVIRGEITGMTLPFQLKQGFRVLAVVPDYLPGDPESLGYAAVIEWINRQAATPSDYGTYDPKFALPESR
ncbi:MAG: GNAT family N-acetyltransferase [Nitrospira sp.]|nr:GNAT family N-acetyltransferase [Nitrospira sp.]